MMTEGTSHLRQLAEKRGRRSEFFGMLLLLLKGYRILGRRVRTPAGEIDLIAQSPRGILCFVEVKGRETLREAKEALLPRQQARISRAAEIYLKQQRRALPKGVRFDTIVVPERRWPMHVKNAWRPDPNWGTGRP